MSLQSLLTTAVAAAEPELDTHYKNTSEPTRGTALRVAEILGKNAVSLDTGGALTIKATMAQEFPRLALSTSISTAAQTQLALIKEMIASGILTGIVAHDTDPGVTLRVI